MRISDGAREAIVWGRAGTIVGVTTTMLAAYEARMRLAPEGERAAIFDEGLRRWARAILAVLGFRLTVEGASPPRARGARLVVSCHRSPVDVLVLLSLFGGRVLSRADLGKWPLIGPLSQRGGTIFVDRSSGSSGARAIRQIRRALAAGDTITLFPEGATYPGDEVRPFRAGAFLTVRGLDVEVVPAGLAYPEGCEFWQESFPAHVRRVASRARTDVAVCVGEGRRADGKPEVMASALRDEVQALTTRARRRLARL